MAWYWFISKVRNETVTRDKVTKVLPFRLPFCSLRFRLPSPSCSNASSSSSFGVSSPLLLQEQWGFFFSFFGYYFTVSHTTATASFAFVLFFFLFTTHVPLHSVSPRGSKHSPKGACSVSSLSLTYFWIVTTSIDWSPFVFVYFVLQGNQPESNPSRRPADRRRRKESTSTPHHHH